MACAWVAIAPRGHSSANIANGKDVSPGTCKTASIGHRSSHTRNTSFPEASCSEHIEISVWLVDENHRAIKKVGIHRHRRVRKIAMDHAMAISMTFQASGITRRPTGNVTEVSERSA